MPSNPNEMPPNPLSIQQPTNPKLSGLPSLQLSLRKPSIGIQGLTLQRFYAILPESCGIFSDQDFLADQASLEKAYDSGSMSNHCAQHATYHAIAAANGDTISPLMMRIHLQKSVASLAHYVEASAKYNYEVPLPPDRTFAGLRGSLIVTERNRPLAAPAPTASSMGFAAATKSPSDPTEEI